MRTATARRTNALMMLTMRDDLDGLTAAGIARSYGLSEPEAAAMLDQARARRGG